MKKRDKNLLVSGLITAGIGLLVILLLCLLLPFLLLRLDGGDGILKLFVILFLIIGALTSSLLASRLNQALCFAAFVDCNFGKAKPFYAYALCPHRRIGFVFDPLFYAKPR